MECKKNGNFFKKIPLILGVISFFVLYGGIKLIHSESYSQDTLLRLALSIIMILVMLPAAGDRWLKFPGGGWKESFKYCKWLLIVTAIANVVIFILGAIIQAATGKSESVTQFFSEDLSNSSDTSVSLIKVIVVVFYFVSVGLVEELGVRRAIFDLGMQQFPKMKHKVLWWAVISAFVFGFMHVMGSLSADPTSIASATLKTIESGMFGFVMCAAVIESQNIWTVAAIHAINDLIPGWMLIIESDTRMKTNYAAAATSWGDWLNGNYSVILFILVYIPFVIKAYRKLKEYDQKQAF